MEREEKEDKEQDKDGNHDGEENQVELIFGKKAFTTEEKNQYDRWSLKRLSRALKEMNRKNERSNEERRQYVKDIFIKKTSREKGDSRELARLKLEKGWENVYNRIWKFKNQTGAEHHKYSRRPKEMKQMMKEINRIEKTKTRLLNYMEGEREKKEMRKTAKVIDAQRGELMHLWEEKEDQRQEAQGNPDEWVERVKHTRMGLHIIQPNGVRRKKEYLGVSTAQKKIEKDIEIKKKELDKEKEEEVRKLINKEITTLEK